MLTCPHCRSSNPDNHNFCQSCGRSLKHYICHNCSSDVEFDAQNCPQCQAISGTYWQAIIELTASETMGASIVPITSTDESNSDAPGLPIATVTDSASDLQTLISPWDLPPPVLAVPVEIAPANLSSGTISDDLETNPWDLGRAEPTISR